MITLDTNYLIRFFTNDVKPQALAAKKLIEKEKEIYIPPIAIAETVYILKNNYQTKKTPLCEKLLLFLKQPNIKTPDYIAFALQIYEIEAISFYDCLILAESLKKNCALKTLDKKLHKIWLKYLN